MLTAEGSARRIGAPHTAWQRFDAERREAAQSTIWATGCQSWNLDESGLPSAWPFTYDRFEAEMQSPRLEDYDRQ